MAEQDQPAPLFERAKAGDRAAFEELVERYSDRLRTAVRQHVGVRKRAVDVEDILQETFLRAFGGIDRFVWSGEDSLYPWLYGIARKVFLKFAEVSRRSHSLAIPERVTADEAAPSKATRRKERFDRLEACLAQLKPEYREVLRLTRLQGLSIEETAERMGRTKYAVKHLVARALRRLRESFGDTESFHLPHQCLDGEGDRDGKG